MLREYRNVPLDHQYEWDWERAQPVLMKGLSLLKLSPKQKQLEQFRAYYSELLKWNRVASLISKGDEGRFVTQHLLPSVVILGFIPTHLLGLADVGSGAGLPGIPLKIMRPELKLTMIEAEFKKALFLREVVAKLFLSDVEVLHKRAEELATCYPMVVTRALGKLSETIRVCLPLVKLRGTLLILRSPSKDRELGVARPWIEKYGGRLVEVKEIVFPITERHGSLVMVSKVSRET